MKTCLYSWVIIAFTCLCVSMGVYCNYANGGVLSVPKQTAVVEDYQVDLTLAVAHLEGLNRDQAMILLALCAFDSQKDKIRGINFNLNQYAYWAHEYCNIIKEKRIMSVGFNDLDKLRSSDELNLNQCQYVLDHIKDYKDVLY